MKSLILSVSMFLFFVDFSFCQMQKTENNTTVSTNTPSESVTPTKTLEQINYELNAIDKKIEYVKSRPDEMEIAKKEHWFEDMEIYRKSLLDQKAILLLQK
jgi:hypothetical protein